MQSNMVQNNPCCMAALQKNILEHISLMAQEQVQLEFVEELNANAQQMQHDAQNPQDDAKSTRCKHQQRSTDNKIEC